MAASKRAKGKTIHVRGPGLNDFFAQGLVAIKGAGAAMASTTGPAREAVDRVLLVADSHESRITLQVNSTGAWRNVIEFDAVRRDNVVQALRTLALALGGARFCLLHADGKREWLECGQ